ncbi:unnamed protein product [Musa acuminata subsp. malaccensis]|uniref:(wild Malaysian banana) hypothetical protein n=1 Tax=Musa acuminata subsp. malaccensis TaxID=214687 RepID=A0A804IWA4_MUSAM|nr:unnamed protein product [Musa acuminata subsp. malaccensis]
MKSKVDRLKGVPKLNCGSGLDPGEGPRSRGVHWDRDPSHPRPQGRAEQTSVPSRGASGVDGLVFRNCFVKAVRKFTSPRAQRKSLVNKNVFLLKSIDELFLKGKDEVNNSALKDLMQKTGFSMEDILRKYIRYALNEKPFNTDLVVDLIHLRKSSLLEDAQVAEILNEVSRRTVKDKGPAVMDLSGFTENGFK